MATSMIDRPVMIDEAALKQIVDSTPSMIGLYNIATGQYIYVNKAVTSLLGYSPHVFLDQGVSFATSLVHPDDLPDILEKNQLALDKANTAFRKHLTDKIIVAFEYRMKHQDGSWIWLHTTGSVFSRDDTGSVECVINISIDITERKRMEAQILQMQRALEEKIALRTEKLHKKEQEAKETYTLLRESKERYQAFISQSSEAIWRFELDKPISTKLSIAKQIDLMYEHAYLAECNDVCAQMYGFKKASDIVGVRLPEMLLRDDPRNIAYLSDFITSGYRLLNAESCEMDRDGKLKYFSNNLIGIVENGMVHRAWGTQRDITQRKELEQQKDDFIAIASHELRTPLTSIKAFAQILQRRFANSLDPKLAAYIAKMDAEVGKLSDLVSDLLDVTKIGAGKLKMHKQSFHFGSLVRDVVDSIQLSAEHHKILLRGRGNVTIRSDKERIRQVLSNLISNAIKYSPDADKVIVTVKVKRDRIEVTVQDFGIGISELDQERIFDRFYRADQQHTQTYPGLGLGLYISAEIIHKLDGELWVKSVKGEGSTFGFELPIN